MTLSKPQPDKPQFSLLTIFFRNLGEAPLSEFNFLAAPPKHVKFIVSPLTSTILGPREVQSVLIKVANSAQGEVCHAPLSLSSHSRQKPIGMKFRITFTQLGRSIVVEDVVKSFPSGY